MVASEGRNAVKLISAILQGMDMWNFIKTKCECVVIFIFVFIHLCHGCENITFWNTKHVLYMLYCAPVSLVFRCTLSAYHVSSLKLNRLWLRLVLGIFITHLFQKCNWFMLVHCSFLSASILIIFLTDVLYSKFVQSVKYLSCWLINVLFQTFTNIV